MEKGNPFMDKSFIFIDPTSLVEEFGQRETRIITKVVRKLVKKVERRILPTGSELLIVEVHRGMTSPYCHICLCKLEPRGCSFKVQVLYSFATIFIHVFTDNTWSLGVGECGATMESITGDMYEAFRVKHHSVEDQDYM